MCSTNARRRLISAAMHDLDESQLDAAVPQWRQVVHDPAFSAWLTLEDRRTGHRRRQLFDHAQATGDTAGVVELLKHYIWRQKMNAIDWANMRGMSPPPSPRSTYSRADIRQNYAAHRRGEFAGREDAWDQLERDMIAASREGRVLDPQPITKNWQDGKA